MASAALPSQAVRDVVRHSGVTCVWATHRLDELEEADSVTLMDEGRVVVTGAWPAVRPRVVRAMDDIARTGAGVEGLA